MKNSSDDFFEHLMQNQPTEGASGAPGKGEASHYIKLVQQFAKVMAISDKYQAEVVDMAEQLRGSKQQLESAQRELRQSETRFRNLIENLPVGVAMFSTDMSLLTINPMMDRWFPAITKGPCCDTGEILEEDDDSDQTKPSPVLRALADGRIHTGEFEITSDHERRVLQVTATAVKNADDEVTAVIEMAEDITERKRTEAERKRLDAQDRSLEKSESLSRMAAAIAHHFNNQLQSVMGNLELVMDDVSREDPINLRLNSAMQAARKAAEMSALMRAYLGQASLRLQTIDLAATCRDNLAALTANLPDGFTLRTEIPDSGPLIKAGGEQIKQILSSLVTNAWEAMEEAERGVIRIKVKTVNPGEISAPYRFPVGWSPSNRDSACLEVSDSGKGIESADIDKIFDPFFSNKFTGRGLGLSVVLGMIRAAGGGVTVNTRPGIGSTFRCFFPVIADSIACKQDGKTRQAPNDRPAKILLVEDEKAVREMSVVMLQRIGFEVVEAEDGEKAVEIFQRAPQEFNCVVCDLSMPRMNGWETLTALRSIQANIPVVLSSGFEEGYVMKDEHEEKPQAFVSKPYNIEDLRNAINRALGVNEP